MINGIKIKLIDFYCGFKSKSTYPEDLKNSLDGVLKSSRKIKVVVIDDHDFPYEDTLSNEGCLVKCHKKVTRDIVQSGQKLKMISLNSPDIIFCDINGVGEELYKDYKGLGVVENMREKYPFSAIYAYTGSPGFVSTRLKNSSAIDGIFAKEWLADDFLVNFNKAKKKFTCPNERWIFIRDRLSHLSASEKKIDELRLAYVKSVLKSRMLQQEMGMKSSEVLALISDQNDSSLDYVYWAKFGIGTASELYSIFSPLMSE